MGFDQPSHWLIVIVIAVVLFGGYKKLPEMSRSVGRSLRIFKSEMKGLTEDDEAREAAKRQQTGQPSTPSAPPVTPAAVDVSDATTAPGVTPPTE